MKPFSAGGSGTVGAPVTETTACSIASPVLVDLQRLRELARAAGCGRARPVCGCAWTSSETAPRVLRHRARGQHQPGVLLRRGVGRMRPRLLDALHRRCDGRPRAAGFARERHQRRRVAQRRAVVVAAEQLGSGRRLEVVERRLVDALGAGAVAEQAERRGDLRLGDRRCEIVELGVGEIAQIAERGDAVPRQHVERVGEVAAAVLRRRPARCRRRCAADRARA